MLTCRSSVITHLAKGGSRDLSVSFPLFKLRCHDVVPEKLEDLVFPHRLGEPWARTEYDLHKVDNQLLPVSHNWVQEATMTSTDLNCVGISDRECTPGGRPQANLSMG
jgi:hypothetical protein